MPIKDRIEHVLTHASKVHPQIRAEYETAYCTFWEKIPYSLGAFAGGGGAPVPAGGAPAGGAPAGGAPAGGAAPGGAAPGGSTASALSTADRLAALGKPDGRIYLGCAAVSGNGGWQEGAVAAAWKQVKQLHEIAMTRQQTAS
jgi:monoamine oxidase